MTTTTTTTTLLVPVDGSATALRALDHAVLMARKFAPARILVVTVGEAVGDNPRAVAFQSRATLEAAEAQRCAALLAPAKAAVNAAGIPCETKCLSGTPADAVIACAADMGCDAIIMGGRGLGAVGSLLLGSVATRVVQQAKIPVTIVK